VSDLAAQHPQTAGRNNPFTPSPAIGSLSEGVTAAVSIIPHGLTAAETADPRISQSPPSTRQGGDYRIGPGDVLKIDNTLDSSTIYMTVSAEGNRIPNTTGLIDLTGKTQEAVEAEIRDRIGVDGIRVTVREYASHFVLVSKNGEQTFRFALRRESMPLFILLSEAGVGPEYRFAILKRADGQDVALELSRSSAKDVSLFAGDRLDLRERL
jgi:hypothetical protein